MKHGDYNHYVVMFFIMIFSGLLSTMNVWVDKSDDIRFSINDVYMTLLMTGWMFLFMGIYYSETPILYLGLFLVVINIWCIRTQFMVSNEQYILGMIPHHSMAVLMSKKLLERKSPLPNNFISNIIITQEKEIEYMKQIYKRSKLLA
uniref:DUF305 domain-containing protein n=1 Tax=viral metagenome TaxID=1070528 RepID=A0A6C0DJ76_9ZZZZ